MLLGRGRERQALDDVVAAARRGESAVCAIVGEPGIGKTALLDDVAGRARDLRTLRARGVESEAQVPFGGLLELLRPELALLDRLPEPQAAALGGALALRPGGARDRFAVGAATLSLLALVAEERPLLVLVDDVHWLDDASAEAVRFALRRLLGDPIAVVLTAREGEPTLLDGAALPTLHLGGLDREAAAALVARQATAVPDEAVERLYRATGGNPLALQELAGDAPALVGAPDGTPLAVTANLVRAFGGRVQSLPRGTRSVLLLAAAADRGDVAEVALAARRLGLELDELAPAEAAGVVAFDGQTLTFRHPLMRSAIYAAAPAPERRRAHRALADALPDRDADRRAWHLAAATVGPDDAASAALAAAATRARERGAQGVAASAYERAARLTTSSARRAELLHAAGDAAWVGGLPERAEALLEEAAGTADASTALAVDHLRGRVAVRRGRVRDGYALLTDAAGRAADAEPARAAIMLAEASNACYYAADVPRMLAAAERALELVPAGDDGEAAYVAAMAHGMAVLLAGGGQPAAGEIRFGLSLLEAPVRAHPSLLAFAANGTAWLREETGLEVIEAALERARRETALGVLPFLLLPVGRIHATGDHWTAAQASYHEGIRLAREAGQLTDLAMLLAGLAWLEARQGREQDCREHVAAARSGETGTGMHDIWCLAALGTLELGLGNAPAAASVLEELDALLRERGVGDADMWPAPELVEAYLRLGRSADASEVAARFEAQARTKGHPWALACAARCRGQVGPDGELDAHFGEALALHARTPDAFAAACTRLAYGARLRRARRRADAREPLRAALAAFEQLGAAPWAETARSELAATGETARRREPSTRDQLTPQELQIALLLADGRTTREAATALFLSPKTIEYHLRNAYRKLGVRSREELAAAMAAER